MILITGGAGFIGSNFVLDWLAQSDERIVNLDKLTYAGNLHNLSSLSKDPRHIFVQGDIGDTKLVSQILAQYQPRAIINMAAESHVDRSIHGPEDFIQTNILGTFRLLEAVRAYWNELESIAAEARKELASAEAQIAESTQKPSGLLRVTTTVAFGSICLTPRLPPPPCAAIAGRRRTACRCRRAVVPPMS